VDGWFLFALYLVQLMESYIQFFLFDALTLQKKMGFLPLFFSFGDLILFYFFFVLVSG